MSLLKRLYFSFGLLLVLLAVTSLFSVFGLSQQRKFTVQITDTWLPSVAKSGEINLNVTKYRLYELESLTARDPKERVALKDKFDEVQQNLFIYLKVFEPLLQTNEQKASYADFTSAWEKYQEQHDQFVKLLEADKMDEAHSSMAASKASYDKVSSALAQLADQSFLGAVKESDEGATQFQRGRTIFIGFLAFCLVLGIGICLWVAYNVKQNLNHIAHQISDAAEVVKSRSNELSASSEQLSGGASESAASLQETVASMEQLTAVVKTNSETARSASVLTEKSNVSVLRGREKISELISNMNEVSESSNKIDEILEIIDDIAFQTNLLALNAAVEAARAGEHGKGFAVVAEAVRSLALKSATSASEIGALVSNSKDKVNKGVVLAAEGNQALEEIVKAFGEVNNLIKDVASASGEQSLGIDSVGAAMNQIDKATQEQVISTQVISGSAQQMQSQAEGLTHLVEELRRFSGVKEKTDKLNTQQAA